MPGRYPASPQERAAGLPPGSPAKAPTSKREIGPGTGDVAPSTTGSFRTNFTCRDCDVICTIPGHAEKGMRGTLTIKGSPRVE